METNSKTFVYEGTEVKKTGRTATRSVRGKSHVIVEITPIDPTFDWKKWVVEDVLYIVKDSIT